MPVSLVVGAACARAAAADSAPRRRPIEKSTKRVVRSRSLRRDRTVTEEEIRACSRRKPLCVRAGRRCAMLRNGAAGFAGAWVQPSAAEAAGATAEVTILLTTGGKIVTRTLSRSSGNALFDGTVMRAVETVSTIPGLTPGFLQSASGGNGAVPIGVGVGMQRADSSLDDSWRFSAIPVCARMCASSRRGAGRTPSMLAVLQPIRTPCRHGPARCCRWTSNGPAGSSDDRDAAAVRAEGNCDVQGTGCPSLPGNEHADRHAFLSRRYTDTGKRVRSWRTVSDDIVQAVTETAASPPRASRWWVAAMVRRNCTSWTQTARGSSG